YSQGVFKRRGVGRIEHQGRRNGGLYPFDKGRENLAFVYLGQAAVYIQKVGAAFGLGDCLSRGKGPVARLKCFFEGLFARRVYAFAHKLKPVQNNGLAFGAYGVWFNPFAVEGFSALGDFTDFFYVFGVGAAAAANNAYPD